MAGLWERDKTDSSGNSIDSSGNSIDSSGNKIPGKTENKPEKPRSWTDTDSWVSFVKSLFVYFLLTMLVGVFGSSFIYLTTRGSDLDTILPTDDLFYSAKKYQTQQKNAYNIVDCNETSTGSSSVLENNFPYNLIEIKGTPTKEQLKQLSFIKRITNWFAKSVAGCFKSNRALLKGYLGSFSPDSPLGNHVFQMYLAAPFTLFAGGFFSLFSGYFTALGAGFATDWKITILGFFFLFSFGLFGGLSGVIFMRLVATLLFYPMSQNWKEVANIMACNVTALVVLFGFFVCGSAYDTLDPTIAGIMGVVYLILVVYSLWKYFTK